MVIEYHGIISEAIHEMNSCISSIRIVPQSSGPLTPSIQQKNNLIIFTKPVDLKSWLQYIKQHQNDSSFFTSRVSGRGYKNGGVCVCVCQCVNTLTAEPIGIHSQNLVQGLTFMKSRTSLMVKVIGQRSGSPGQKT